MIFEVCHIYPGKGSFTSFATCWAKLLILPYWDIKKATHSLDLCNFRIIHTVSLSLLLFRGDVDSKGLRPYNFTVY